MADTKISGLVAASDATGAEFVGIQSGVTKRFATALLGGAAVWGGITGTLSAQTDLQTALDSKQPIDTDLTTIASLTATTDNFLQAKAGAWASRTVAQVKTDLGLTGTNSGDQTITLTSDVTGSGTGSFAATIANNAVTNAKAADMATSTIKGRATAGTGDPEDLTAAQVRTIINVADGATANSSDAALRDRSTHTGSQASTTISDFAEAVDDRVAALLVPGANVTLTYNDAANTLTVAASGGGGSGDVVGPASSVDNALAVFDGTTGKLVQESSIRVTDNGSLVLPENSAPTASDPGEMKLFSREIAKRLMPAFIGPSGLDSTLQPLLARNKVGYWCPPGNATTVPGVLGFTAPTVTGFTATARNVATTNLFTRMRRLGYVTATTAGTVGQWRVSVGQYTVGDSSTNLGGFTHIIRFGISDAAAVSGARMFKGLRSTSTPTNVEPSTLTNCIGIGHGASDTNFKLFYGGTSAQTPIDLGANFPSNTRSTDVYELALFSAPNSGDVHYEVTRLNTGHVAKGTIVNSGATVLPTNTTLIGPWGYRTNNATALAVAIDVMSAYIETDY